MVDKIDHIPLENIYQVDTTLRKRIPFFLSEVHAGFPSPAENYVERRLNLQDLCVRYPDATYFVRVAGESMVGAHIFPGSILVVDSVKPVTTGQIIVAWLNGECCVRIFERKKKLIILHAHNEKYLPIYVHIGRDKLRVMGCVTFIISKPDKHVFFD